jgi:hypothetical protein
MSPFSFGSETHARVRWLFRSRHPVDLFSSNPFTLADFRCGLGRQTVKNCDGLGLCKASADEIIRNIDPKPAVARQSCPASFLSWRFRL